MLSINKNVPMPEKKSPAAAFRSKYPWKDMVITDSFFVQGKNEGKVKRYMATLASKVGKKLNKKFYVDDTAPTGVNVFCTATGLGTADAQVWDFNTKEIIKFNDAPKEVEPPSYPPPSTGSSEAAPE